MNASKFAAQCNFMPAAYFGEIPQDSTISPNHRWHKRGDPDCQGECLEALGADSVDGKAYSGQLRCQARHIPRCWSTSGDGTPGRSPITLSAAPLWAEFLYDGTETTMEHLLLLCCGRED